MKLSRLRTALYALAVALGCTRNEPAPPKSSPKPDSARVSANDNAEPEAVSLEGRAFPLVIASALVVEQGYFDRGRFAPRRQLAAALEALGMHEPAFFGSLDGDVITVRVGRDERRFALGDVKGLPTAADVLESILVFCRDSLKLRQDQVRPLEYAAINGFLSPLDPHTILLTPEERTELGVRTTGRYGGIGAEIASRERRIAIVGVLPGTPAEAAGLLPGDVILKIGNQATVNMTATDAMQLVRGPIGTAVRLEIRRGKRHLTITVSRQQIAIDSVRSADLGDQIAYIGLSHFQEDSAEKMTAAIEGFETRPRAIVLDLRGNSGGLLAEATEVLDAFVDAGELVIVHSSAGREAMEAKPERAFGPELGVVAIIDENSASAAEIVSGAIKHLGRGIVVGRGSFGKGSVQKLLPLEIDDRPLAIKQTIAEYRVAGERKIQTVGVTPDVELWPVRLAEFPGVAQYDDDERFERARERFQTASLPSAIHEHGATTFLGRPGPKLRFLDAPPQEPALDPTKRLLADGEIRLAKSLATQLAGVTARRDMVDKLPAIVDALAEIEDAALVAALAERDVDWSVDTQPPPPLRLDVALGSEGPLTAGSPFSLKLTVHNDGDRPAYRVRTTTDCPLDELDGIELLFGRVDAGAAVERTLALEVMAWHPDLHDRLDVSLYAGADRDVRGRGHVELDVTANPRPQLAFDHWIVDDPKQVKRSPKRGAVDMERGGRRFTVTGNGDGMLGIGECVLLAFRVHNRGPGPSQDTRMMVRNLSGTQGLLEEGLFDLDAIAAGKSTAGAFGFCVADDADPKRPVELMLTAADARLRERTDRQLELRVVAKRDAFAPSRERVSVGHDGARLYNGADSSAAVVDTLAPNQSLASIGRAGPWVAVAGPDARRLWTPADVLVFDGDKRSTAPQIDPSIGPLVDPPQIVLSPVTKSPNAQTVTLRGVVTPRRGVRDVVVYRTSGGPTARPHKASFRAADRTPEPTPLQFSFDIALEPGSNHLIVEARDIDDVIAQREVWVYRDQAP